MPSERDLHPDLPTFSEAGVDSDQNDIPLPPPDIRGYTITQALGQGGMGAVWQAVQISTKRLVALKVINARAIGFSRARARFEREIEFAARLEHPTIARVYESGMQARAYYYAMELIKGVPLDAYIRAKAMPVRQVIELILKVCSGVQYAHQHGIIHRDLKPSNILVTEDEQPHILDFGLAKDLLNDQHATVSLEGDILGTPAYMSPEQASGQHDQVDSRTDIYSIGVMLYSFLFQQFPYDVTGSLPQVLAEIRDTVPPGCKAIGIRLDSDLEAVLLKTLAKDPQDRYQSIAELSHDLSCWLQGDPIVIKSAGSLYLLSKILKRHQYTSMVAGLLVIIVFGFLGIAWHLYSQVRHTRAELEKTSKSLETQIEENTALGQHLMLADHFLPAWHKGRLVEAQVAARYFAPGGREAVAATFLLDARALELKQTSLQKVLPDSEQAFSYFILAEHHVRDGAHQQAIQAYERCLATAAEGQRNQWMIDKARSRLFELRQRP